MKCINLLLVAFMVVLTTGDDVDQETSYIRGLQVPSLDYRSRERIPRQDSCKECSSGTSGRFVGNTRDEIFNQLNPTEHQSLVNYVLSIGLADLTLDEVNSSNQALNRNYIVFLQLFPPPKSEALAYLDGQTNTPPKRYGIVTVHRGRSRPRDVMQYKVGPLENGQVVTSGTIAEPMLQNNELPWSMRGNYRSENFLHQAISNKASILQDVFRHTTGGYCFGGAACDHGDNIIYHTSASLGTTTTQRVTNVMFYLAPSSAFYGSPFLMPIPISFQLVEDPDTDPSTWQTINYEYCYQGPFNSAAQLRARFNRNELQKCTLPNSNFEWTLTDPVEPIRSDSTIKEPVSFHSSGKRYNIQSASSRRVLQERRQIEETNDVSKYHLSNYFKYHSHSSNRKQRSEQNKEKQNRKLQSVGVDGTGHIVSWMDWSFHVSSDQMSGMVISDLSFKGERLAYRLDFQEYFASYSSAGSASHVFYFDSNWEIGYYSPLVRGVDCPEDATLLPIIQRTASEAYVSSNLICIFEQPYGEPLWRHGFNDDNIGGIPRTALKVRVVSTMGNYDYIPTLSLMADGVMELKLEMGGYLQGGYSANVGEFNEESPYYGTQLRDNMVGLLHDHIIGVKADLDIGGVKNTLMAGKVEYGTYQEATGKPASWLSHDGAKYMKWETIDTERGISARDYTTIMVTSPTTNSWGAKRSYEIAFHSTIPSQVYPPEHPLGATTAWQYSNVAVTRQKDAERMCSFPSNFLVGSSVPSFDLREFQKGGDSVIDEDLVFWIMFGVQHYPKAEDVPLVSNFGTGFMLKPRNMYDRAAFEDLADNRNSDHPVCVAPIIFS